MYVESNRGLVHVHIGMAVAKVAFLPSSHTMDVNTRIYQYNLKPPSQEALQDAMEALLSSLEQENGLAL